MSDLSGLFDLNPSGFIKEQKQGNSDLYRPSAQDGKDNVYKSLVKFVPWHADPQNKSIISKWVVWLTNPSTEEAKMIDCPSTIGAKSILQDTFFKLYKSPNAQEQELSRHFSRREQFFSLLYIIKDENFPELNGQIKIFRYGKKIYEKLQGIIQHTEESNMPFDIFNGRPFMLHITKVAGFNNYDNSSFLSKAYPLPINGKALADDPKNYPIIMEYLKENSPDISQYEYKEWNEETKQFVLDSIDAIIPSGKIKEQILSLNRTTSSGNDYGSTTKPKAKAKPKKEEEIPDFNPTVETPKSNAKLNIEDDSIDDFIAETSNSPKKNDSLDDFDLDDDDIFSELD